MNPLKLPPAWASALAPAFASPPVQALLHRLDAEEAAGATIYPPRGQRLAALELTPPETVKVVILGQDPYHGPGQAQGLAFSVPPGVRPPPSLVNIAKELASDLGVSRPSGSDLRPWARQGVLLLNAALTVEAGRAGSHQGWGWEPFTDAVIATIARRPDPCVFLLWGAHAQRKAERVPALAEAERDGTPHLVLRAAHPSPLSARNGFFGSRPFSRANAFLAAHGRPPVDWRW